MYYGVKDFLEKQAFILDDFTDDELDFIHRVGDRNYRKAFKKNIDRWGKDQDHNILYVTGYPGSGKSIVALNLADNHNKIIHLDAYTQDNMKDWRDKDFNKYLDKHMPGWEMISDSKYRVPRNLANDFNNNLNAFGKEQFNKGNKVVAEGIHIFNKWLTNDYDNYNNKPMLILRTNWPLASYRASKRDGVKGNGTIKHFLNNIKYYKNDHQQINDLMAHI